jgi:uncharacterized protein
MNRSIRRWTPRFAFFLVALASAFALHEYFQERALHDLPHGFKRFDRSGQLPACGRWKEHMPAARDPSAYRLYIEARGIWHSKIGWQLTRAETTRILADVSKAADLGDWGARALMAHFYMHGLGTLESNHVLDADPEKAVEIRRAAAEAGLPWGLYDLGVAYEHGYGGVTQDEDLAWAYYLRAAQLGSPEAQMALASAYGKAGRRNEVEVMLRCAYQQGHGPAAYELGMWAEVRNQFQDAINLYHDGVKFGCADCAAALELLFMRGHSLNAKQDEIDRMKELQITRDPERERRYNAIYHALKVNPDLRLKRLDNIVPLPPAPLPEWSGLEAAIEPAPEGPPTY